MPKFTAIEPVKHNGRRYEPDDTLELTQAHAAPLLALGAIEPERKPQAKPAAEKAAVEVQEVAQAEAQTAAEKAAVEVQDVAQAEAQTAAQGTLG